MLVFHWGTDGYDCGRFFIDTGRLHQTDGSLQINGSHHPARCCQPGVVLYDIVIQRATNPRSSGCKASDAENVSFGVQGASK